MAERPFPFPWPGPGPIVSSVTESWSVGEAYELYMGRWSREVAAAFLTVLDVPARRRWLDVGCGTGALASAVLAVADPLELVGVDPSDGLLALAGARVRAPSCRFLVGDARSLPFPDRAFDVVVSGLALNFVPDAPQAVAEFARVCAPGGVVAAYVWDYAEGMAMLRYFWDAAVALDADSAAHDEGARFPICRPDPLSSLWRSAGLTNIRVDPVDIDTTFADFDDYWTPFLGGQGPAPGYVAALPEDRRGPLRDLLRARLPVSPQGSIPLTARAWAVRGEPTGG